MSDRALRIGLPIVMLAIAVLVWHLVVQTFTLPPYVLPGPGLVARTLITDGNLLWNSLLVTLITTFEGFLLAAVGGIGLAILFNQSRLVEYSFYPYAVILQVTPIVAIAPLLLIYLPQPLAVLVCAWIVAFFPVLANTTLGLSSVDHNLLALFDLYKASLRRISRCTRWADVERRPARTSRTTSQSGTLRRSRSTIAVPRNPVPPVTAMRFPPRRLLQLEWN